MVEIRFLRDSFGDFICILRLSHPHLLTNFNSKVRTQACEQGPKGPNHTAPHSLSLCGVATHYVRSATRVTATSPKKTSGTVEASGDVPHFSAAPSPSPLPHPLAILRLPPFTRLALHSPPCPTVRASTRSSVRRGLPPHHRPRHHPTYSPSSLSLHVTLSASSPLVSRPLPQPRLVARPHPCTSSTMAEAKNASVAVHLTGCGG